MILFSFAFTFVGSICFSFGFLIYTAVACISFTQKGDTAKAIVFGATIVLCLGLGDLHGTLIDLEMADPPYLGSFLFLPLSLVMSYTLAGGLVKAPN